MDSDSSSKTEQVSARSILAVFVITALLGTAIAYFVLCIAAYSRYCNEWSGMLLPGYRFGMPQRLLDEGVYPVHEIGWDGQFYYIQANYLNPVPEAYDHIPDLSYRYQRIGLPLVAAVFSWMIGSDYVSPHTYLFASLPFVGLGMGALAAWLFAHRYSPLWCLGWAANVGIPICLLHGQPDPLADALFILAMLALIRGMPLAYAAAASLMCLTREPYFAIAGAVFAASVAGMVPWKGNPETGGWVIAILRAIGLQRLADWLMVTPEVEQQSTILSGRPSAWNFWAYRTPIWQLLILLVPCVVFLAWQVYLRSVFGHTGSEAAGGVILDIPFYAFFKSSMKAPDFVLRPFYFATLIMGFIVLWSVRRKLSMSLIILPYFCVLSMMSEIVWIDLSGYSKAMGTVLAAAVICLPLVGKKMYYAVGLLLVLSVLTYTQCFKLVYGPVDLIGIPDYQVVNLDMQDTQPVLAAPKCTIEVDQNELLKHASDMNGVYRFELGGRRYPQTYFTVPVTVTNEGTETWEHSRQNAIQIVPGWYKEGELPSWKPATDVPNKVAPGESFTREVPILLPRSPGDFTLRITLRQLGQFSFDEKGKDYVDIPISYR
ncbi:hypothetical protein C5Y96_02770 [Blastopirellula marina]|uniref:Glycosyltransferase RgtA/B/C/D-like domain-containing protein n=1 Tax=Blastopirellula marina TaxID=124 RepID=A0A2S8G2Y0_9BACT|nr:MULTISPECIES: hypothetical protein [Pirellulaceae]PQO38809.1 hypothetical protein C5Y96_02770 [Blastopirellula marina]RCS55117.1 hypothetical protein DTL36_02775 [Bremerella cremea]